MTELKVSKFDVAGFLASAGLGRRIVHLTPNQPFFSQGIIADSVFYLRKGRAKLTVVSKNGKRQQSRFSPRAILLERSPLLERLASD